MRIEQLHPLDRAELKNAIGRYSGIKECVWVQEEHRNMGAWEYIRPLIQEAIGDSAEVSYVGREKSASTAAGSYNLHRKEQAALFDAAFKTGE